MLKYIKHHLTGILGIEIYPIISFVIFFTFFLLVLLWMLKVDKSYLKEMSEMPLDKGDVTE